VRRTEAFDRIRTRADRLDRAALARLGVDATGR